MNRAKTVKKDDKFQASVDYLAEYAGVRGAVIADSEGLVVAQKGAPDFQAEVLAAMVLPLMGAVEGRLPFLKRPEIEHMALKTREDWITVARTHSFYLFIAAERHADELLHIRISRALEMITTHVGERYATVVPGQRPKSEQNTKSMEEIHV